MEAGYRGGFRVGLRVDDGREGEVDLSGELEGEVFEPPRNPGDFAPEFPYERVA